MRLQPALVPSSRKLVLSRSLYRSNTKTCRRSSTVSFQKCWTLSISLTLSTRKTAPPSFTEVFQMLGNMGTGIMDGGSLVGDISKFKAEAAKYKARTGKMVKRVMA